MHLSHRRGYGRCDDDASMRAIRRRGSWESAESRWSWRAGAGGDKDRENSLLAALGRPVDDDVPHNRSSTYTRESLRTAYSARTAPSSSHAHGSPAGQGVFGAAQSEGDLTALTSESALVSHRPVSVRV
jgi:hypothetical protein